MTRVQRFVVLALIASFIMFIGLSAFHGEFQFRIAFQSLITGIVMTFVLDKFSFTKKQIHEIVNEIKFRLDAGESLWKESLAKYARSTAHVGKLGVTTKRLVFQDLNRKEFSLMRSDITGVEIRPTINPKEHVILVKLTDNNTHQFIVGEVEEWVRLVSSNLEEAKDA